MIIRYTEEEFNKAKSDDLLKLECENCGEIFYRKKKEIKHTLEHPDRNRCRFCSTKCLSEFNSVEHYNLKCNNCGKNIIVKSTDFKKSKTKRFFCCNSCAATYNNQLRGPVSDKTKIKTSESLKKYYSTNISSNIKEYKPKKLHTISLVNKLSDDEFKNIIENSITWKCIAEKLGYINALSKNVKESIMKRCGHLNIEMQIKPNFDMLEKTKGEIFSYRKNWQSARSTIRKIAQKVYMKNNAECKCAICGYDKHVEIAHIKAVADFEDSATIKEINGNNNLIALCPNHHWEYDHGLLDISNYINK